MDINFHAHHAVISDRLRARASQAIAKYAERFPETVAATVRFAQDGPNRCVEIVVHGRRGRRWVGEGSGRTYGPALAAALTHLETQLAHDKRTPKDRAQPARLA
jgi:ribosome-associated translation inhibitor RaiA